MASFRFSISFTTPLGYCFPFLDNHVLQKLLVNKKISITLNTWTPVSASRIYSVQLLFMSAAPLIYPRFGTPVRLYLPSFDYVQALGYYTLQLQALWYGV